MSNLLNEELKKERGFVGYDHCGCFTILDNVLTVGESRRESRPVPKRPRRMSGRGGEQFCSGELR